MTPRRGDRVTFTITGELEFHPAEKPPGGIIIFATKRGFTMGEITVRDDETTLAATVTFTDAEGHPTTPDTEPVWEVSDPNVLTVTPAAGGLSATFEVGAPGVCAVTVRTTETHEGEGDPTDVVLSGLVTVTAGDTVTGSVDFTTS